MPGGLGVFLPLLFAVVACMFVAVRRPSLPRLAISVAVSQFLFHTMFVLGTPSNAETVLQPVGHHGGLLVASMPISSMSMTAPGVDTRMWFGHAVAAILTILALHFGERLLILLGQLSTAVSHWWSAHHRATIGSAPAANGRMPSATTRSSAWVFHLLAGSVQRRGPPLRHGTSHPFATII